MAKKAVAKNSKKKKAAPRVPSNGAPAGATAKWVGQPLRRKEEDRLVRGRGIFVDDERMPGMLFIKFVRSSYAHAKITRLDVSKAEKFPRVVCTLTGAEVKSQVQPFIEIGPGGAQKIADYPMAVDKVLYQGEPIAAVVAETRLAAEDAAELLEIEYEPLTPVILAEEALKDESLLHPAMGSNRNWHGLFEYGDVEKTMKQAAHVVHIGRMHFHRFSSTPLECNIIIATWDPRSGDIDYRCNNTFPSFAAQFLSPALGVRIDQIHMKSYDIGGGFGIKITNYPYMAVCALASRKAGGRAVKWVETRIEHMQASAHGNERTFLDTRVALDKNGVIVAIDSKHVDDCGAFPRYEPLGCVIWAQVLPATCRVKNIRIDLHQVVTNKCPVGPNRGYSRMQHLWFMERILDICGHTLGIPGDEMRLRNYIRKNEMPYKTPNGCVYDSGDYANMLSVAKKLLGWDEWKKKQAAARKEGRWIGLGIGSTLDSGTNNFGQARIINPDAPFSGQSKVGIVKLDIYGEVVVSMGSVPQGQGHETAASQVVADALDISPNLVNVRPGFDTAHNAYTGHTGTYASQFAVTGLTAINGAAMKLRKELSRLAAWKLQAKEKNLEFGVGAQGPEVRVKGTQKSINYWSLANLVNVNNAGMPEGLWDITLNCRHVFHADFQIPDVKRKYGNLTLTYAAQVHAAVVEVYRETFQPKILAYACVDDCGKAINPRIVEGQVHGAAAHGVGAALLEDCRYDSDGNLLAATFSDYTPITAVNIPEFLYAHTESPSPFTLNGAKGMGEGGAAPLHTICAALQDALYPSGVIIDDSHNTGDSLFRALQKAESGGYADMVRVEHHSAAR
jgi:CO/xanthine dehydrogenase Mo-binding subunit